jgi:RHS repeat-associated protein
LPHQTRSQILFCNQGHNGELVGILDHRGESVWTARYDPWGKCDSSTSSEFDFSVRLLGQQEDAETGLHYCRNRYYCPEIGQFISPDPFGIIPSENIEIPAPNLVDWADPLGLTCWSTSRKNYWKAVANAELSQTTGRYSATNIQRMLSGKAPRMKIEVRIRKTGQVLTKDVSMELHHMHLPQRGGSAIAGDPWNLAKSTPWGHESMDPFRHTGYDVLKIINGTNSF